MLPNCRCPDWRATLRIRLPSRTQAPPPLPKLMLVYLANAFCSRAATCSGGARYSPSNTSTLDEHQARDERRAGETHYRHDPSARMTVSSLPRASDPNPNSEPMSTVIGNSSNACCGKLSSVNHKASSRRVVADPDVVLLIDENEQARPEGESRP